jgi:hypothetical protein
MHRVVLVFVGLLCSSIAFGQGEANSLEGVPFKERIVTGGGLGLSFSSYQDFFSISPQIGYMVTRRLMAGTGFTYRYTNYKYFKPSMKFNDYGVSPFLRFTVYRNIFIQTEYEYLNYEDFRYPVTPARETVRRNFSSFLAGGGFVQPVGQKISFYIMAMYNFSYKNAAAGEYSPYDSPLIVRAGINVGNIGF